MFSAHCSNIAQHALTVVEIEHSMHTREHCKREHSSNTVLFQSTLPEHSPHSGGVTIVLVNTF